MTDEYKPVNVDAARQIGHAFEKDIVVILSYDDKHEMVHTTTWGATPQLKIAAGRLGEQCCETFGGHPDASMRKYFENFETTPAAEAAMKVDELKLRIATLEREREEWLEGMQAADDVGIRDAVLAIGVERLRQARKGYAAMIAAEIDRLQRLKATAPPA